jgi:acetyltransferase-like isoleucine patch superfamily enzyme/acyl carrier protein
VSSPTEGEVRAAVLAEVGERLAERELSPEELPDDFDLLAEGVIDSFGMLELIGVVEARFGLSIDFEEIDAEDLTSIGPFSRYVASHGPSVSNGNAVEPVLASEPPKPIALGVAPPPGPLRRAVGHAAIGGYRLTRRATNKAFSLLWAGSFASYGSNSVIEVPIRLMGERRIAIGSGVSIGASSWLQAVDGHGEGVALWIGDRVSIAGHCVLSAASSIRIGDSVTFARGVYVADHAHAYRDVTVPVLDQGITDIRPVEIADGAWIGQNAVVLPGVSIGRGAVIGANSVVSHSVPDHAVASGAPARVLFRFS